MSAQAGLKFSGSRAPTVIAGRRQRNKKPGWSLYAPRPYKEIHVSMAVFTPVSDDDARELLQRYNLGELVSLRGITAGIENTNYFLNTTRGEYVLTIFEVLTAEQLPFYIELMTHLAERKVPVPHPQPM